MPSVSKDLEGNNKNKNTELWDEWSKVEHQATWRCCTGRHLWVRLVVFSRRQRGQNHSSCGCCSRSSLVGSMSTGRRAAYSAERAGERGGQIEASEEEISKSASRWKIPQHRPHRMLWCGCSINRPLNKQCRSLNVDSSDPGPAVPLPSSAECCTVSCTFVVLFDLSQSLNSHLLRMRVIRIEQD